MVAAAIRRAAIVVAAMQPDVRAELLLGLEPSTRGLLLDCIAEVESRRWTARGFALRALDVSSDIDGAVPLSDGEPDIPLLADHLDVVELARVLQSRGSVDGDFAFAMLPAQLQQSLRAELGKFGPMPPALSTATRAAALMLQVELRGEN